MLRNVIKIDSSENRVEEKDISFVWERQTHRLTVSSTYASCANWDDDSHRSVSRQMRFDQTSQSLAKEQMLEVQDQESLTYIDSLAPL